MTPPDAEKLTLASREGTLRLAMRNYSDSKIIATNGVAMIDLMHNGAASVPLIQPQPVAGAARPAHLNADGRTPFRVDVMRDGKSAEAISFLNSGRVHRSNQARDDAPAAAPPPAVEAPVATSPAGAAASLAALPDNDLTTAPSGSNDGASANSSMNRVAPLRPGESGYQAAPKTYVVQ